MFIGLSSNISSGQYRHIAQQQGFIRVNNIYKPNTSMSLVDASGVLVRLWADTFEGASITLEDQNISGGRLNASYAGTDFDGEVSPGDPVIGYALWTEGGNARWLYFETTAEGANEVNPRAGGVHSEGGLRPSTTRHAVWV
jgi:hypothetical protein